MHELYHKGVQYIDDIWDSGNHTFLSSHTKFNFTPMEANDWATITTKIIDQWQPFLEDDLDDTIPRQWVGLYREGDVDQTLVLRRLVEFTLFCIHQHHLTTSLRVKCFMMGTYSQCFNEWWEDPPGVSLVFYMRLK